MVLILNNGLKINIITACQQYCIDEKDLLQIICQIDKTIYSIKEVNKFLEKYFMGNLQIKNNDRTFTFNDYFLLKTEEQSDEEGERIIISFAQTLE